jgi:hypothetical protein
VHLPLKDYIATISCNIVQFKAGDVENRRWDGIATNIEEVTIKRAKCDNIESVANAQCPCSITGIGCVNQEDRSKMIKIESAVKGCRE